jgi:chaperonin cofactor prefoldin
MRSLLFVLGMFLLTALALTVPPRCHALPRFTEEREAAALHFVKKHMPELQPLLAELKKTNLPLYHQEISEIFQVSEFLAEMLDEPRRYDLELKIWKADNRAHLLVGRLRVAPEEEAKKLQEQLRETARELVELDIQVLELQGEQLDKELGEVKDELAQAREQLEQNIKTRFDNLLDKSRKPRK